ncbi:hypothetical protein P3342_010927 [Pyrenophora teres f. teres]|nr:hypothetical protein PTNB29_06625 [Pyrenophora teres f. teres]KAK1911843.1 hypothetical protein P3342_010927 [Pyrenophora teres f. teres]CAA9964475.1 hypothetical protein PTMSG1_07834 [Pyrenophora teres f. maculata]
MSPWKSSKTKLEAVQAFRFGDQKHDRKYAPQPEPEDPPEQAFHPVQSGQGENSAYYGPYGPWVPQPPVPYAPGYYPTPTPHPQYPGYTGPHQPPQAPPHGLGIQQQYVYQPQGYGNQQQPSSPPQGQAPFSPVNANPNAYQNNQPYNYSNYGQLPALSASPEAGVQSSPPTHSSPEPPQQAHTRGPQRSLSYDDPYDPYEEQFALTQRMQTEPPQVAPHDCNEYGLAAIGKCTRCGYTPY